jgi:hypothetical protein
MPEDAMMMSYLVQQGGDKFTIGSMGATTIFWLSGTIKEIARQIFEVYLASPSLGPVKTIYCMSVHLDGEHAECHFLPIAVSEIDVRALAREISGELDKLKVLLPFA